MADFKPFEKTELSHTVLAGFLLNALYLYPMVAPGLSNLGQFDTDQHFYFIEAMKRALFVYGQFPGWDPWHLGGMPMLGNPQAPLSPFYFPVLLFGTVVGVKAMLFILQCVGFVGTYCLARHLALDRWGALTSAVVWSMGGLHAVQIQAGWFLFFHLHLMPWAFLCFFAGWRDYRYALPMAAIFALFFLAGVPYPLPITLFALGVVSVVVAVKERSARPLLFLALSVAFTAPLIAVKLVPALTWLGAHMRDTASIVEGYSFAALFWAMMDPKISLHYPTPNIYTTGWLPGTYFWMSLEYGMYLGPVVLLLASVGLFARFAQKTALLVALAATLLLTMGDYAPIPLWSLLQQLPVYDSMRVVERFRWPVVLILSLLAGFGSGKVAGLFQRPGFVQKLLLVAILANLTMVTAPVLRYAFPVSSDKVLKEFNPTGGFYQIHRTNWYNEDGWMSGPNKFLIPAMFPFLMENVGVTIGYEPYNVEIFAKGVGSPDYHGEVFIVAKEGFADARFAEWSPNRVVVAWAGGTVGHLYLNQNWYPGWRVCDGSGLMAEDAGLIKVRIAEKDSRVTLCYASAPAYVSAGVSAVAWFVLIAGSYWLFGKRAPSVPHEATG